METTKLVLPGPVAAHRRFWLPRFAARARADGFVWVVGLVALHAILGVLCAQSKWVAAVHALGTLGVGLALALSGRSLLRIACWAAYVVGAEILWRMANAPVPWELGKYAISLVFFIGFLRHRRRNLPIQPVVYFALLLPAVMVTITQYPFGEWQKMISFNLSGPFSLLVCSLFFFQIGIKAGDLQRIMLWLVVPISGTASASLFGLAIVENIEFTSESNFAATGGFGPNQVSAILGLGALYALLLALDAEADGRRRFLFLALVLWFSAHAALSFSRTGLYLFGGAMLLSLLFLPLRRVFNWRAFAIVGVAVVAGIALWGYLVQFTEGAIVDRFADTTPAGREELAADDLALWKEHPVIGVGVGRSSFERAKVGGQSLAAHTEYTRLLAEHGSFGIGAVLVLFLMSARAAFGRLRGFARAAVVAGCTWALLSLVVSGMRTAAPGFLIGLSCVHALTGASRQRHSKCPSNREGVGSAQNQKARYRRFVRYT